MARLRPRLFSFHDFVEEALFNRRWGYYASGAVRFGDGGDFDTYPLALSPYFGAMVARRAHTLWRLLGSPSQFDVCEIGAGNGQLCLDVLTFTASQARRDGEWGCFERALAYVIVEKSPALRRRQELLLGSLSARVRWRPIDLSRRRRVERLGANALVVANEVLDCLAHHKVVLGRDAEYRVAFVGATRAGRTNDEVPAAKQLLSLERLDAALGRGERLRFHEFLLPLSAVPGLGAFLRRHYPVAEALFSCTSLPWTYFACPTMETFVANTGALYDRAEILLVDYGGGRDFQLRTPGADRVAAGRPEEKGASPYRAPGRDDITFLVDFSVAMTTAAAAGLDVIELAPQKRLAHLSGVRLGPSAVRKIIAHRALTWLLAVSGVGPEHRQRSSALSWHPPGGRRGGKKMLVAEVHEAVDEFLGRRRSSFHLLRLGKGIDELPGAGSKKRACVRGG